MDLVKFNKQLKDLELLYKNGIVNIIIDNNKQQKYRVVSICGKQGEQRSRECKDPNEIFINVKKW